MSQDDIQRIAAYTAEVKGHISIYEKTEWIRAELGIPEKLTFHPDQIAWKRIQENMKELLRDYEDYPEFLEQSVIAEKIAEDPLLLRLLRDKEQSPKVYASWFINCIIRNKKRNKKARELNSKLREEAKGDSERLAVSNLLNPDTDPD
ncbi:hypothetical protein ABW19_dt0201272 [Dactylella cylindrospora]|nr:hypothetical protein ABW19_dt0201272 [Dactylella cylindrospora]